jgi:uncharacterized membrane protein
VTPTDPSAAPAPVLRRPLLLIGIGLVPTLLTPTHGWDYTPDWIGWILVLIGTWFFARELPSRNLLLTSAALSVPAAFALWIPDWNEAIHDQGPAVVWGLLLPEIVWLTLISLAASGLAARQPAAAVWWKYLAGINAIVIVLPAIVYGGGVDGLRNTLDTLRFLGIVGVTILAYAHSGRPWAVTRPKA